MFQYSALSAGLNRKISVSYMYLITFSVAEIGYLPKDIYLSSISPLKITTGINILQLEPTEINSIHNTIAHLCQYTYIPYIHTEFHFLKILS